MVCVCINGEGDAWKAEGMKVTWVNRVVALRFVARGVKVGGEGDGECVASNTSPIPQCHVKEHLGSGFPAECYVSSDNNAVLHMYCIVL